MRLIDADVLMRQIKSVVAEFLYRGDDYILTGKDSCNPAEFTRGYERGALKIANIVSASPAVDAVEVVRCKDCEFGRQPWLEGQTLVKCMKGITKLVDPMHFCGYGERKEK